MLTRWKVLQFHFPPSENVDMSYMNIGHGSPLLLATYTKRATYALQNLLVYSPLLWFRLLCTQIYIRKKLAVDLLLDRLGTGVRISEICWNYFTGIAPARKWRVLWVLYEHPMCVSLPMSLYSSRSINLKRFSVLKNAFKRLLKIKKTQIGKKYIIYIIK